MTRFAAKDPFIDLLAGHNGTWVRLSEHIAAEELRQNEWYTDFVLKSGVRDIVAAQVSDTGSHGRFRRPRGNWRKAADSGEPQAPGSTAGAAS
jgi:hypothetical protein